MLGLGLVSIYKTNMTVNGLTLAQGEALFQNGMKNTSTFTITIMLCFKTHPHPMGYVWCSLMLDLYHVL